MILALVFVVFTALLLNMFIKLFYIRGIFIYSQLSFVFFCVLFLGFFIISYLLVFFFLSLHCSCVFVLTFYMFFICLLILRTNSSAGSTFFIFLPILTKTLIALKVITPLQKIFGSASFLFLKVWFNKSGNITFRLYFYLFLSCFFCTSTLKPQIIRKL